MGVDREQGIGQGKFIVELGDLETESENKGYISSELSDLNDSGAEEIEAVDRVNDGVPQGKFVSSSSGWFESMA